MLAVLFPYKYSIAEVRVRRSHLEKSGIDMDIIDALGVLDLARVRRYSATTLHAATDWRSRDNHNPLPVRLGNLQSVIHPELDMAVLCGRRLLGSDSSPGRDCPDHPLLGLFLHLLYKVRCAVVPGFRSWTKYLLSDRVMQGKRFNLPV